MIQRTSGCIVRLMFEDHCVCARVIKCKDLVKGMPVAHIGES